MRSKAEITANDPCVNSGKSETNNQKKSNLMNAIYIVMRKRQKDE